MRSTFGEPLPDGYKGLLRQMNGIVYQDIEVYGSVRQRLKFVDAPPEFNDPGVFVNAIVAKNEELRSDDDWFSSFVVYGNTEADWLVHNCAARRFERRQQVGRDVVTNFKSFEELLWWTLALRLPLPPIKFVGAG